MHIYKLTNDVVAQLCWGQPQLLAIDIAVDMQAGGGQVETPLCSDLVPQQPGVEP